MILTAFLWLLSVLGTIAQDPLEITWNKDRSYEPDGPWQAVSISVGNQKINLYPGSWFETDVLSTALCIEQQSCPEAGVYDPSKLTASVSPSSFNDTGFIDQWNAGPETNVTRRAEFFLEELAFNTQLGSFAIPDTIFSLIDTSNTKLPNVTTYPSQIGFLALGGPRNDTGPKSLTNSSDIVGNIITGYLFEQNGIRQILLGYTLDLESRNNRVR